jgi:hypothetical protein
MAKITQTSKQWESPQIIADQLATETYGGSAPSKEDVVKSANARGQKRHEMKTQHLADVEVLPDSSEMAGNEMVGIKDAGYLVKKNLEFGVNAHYNSLPPGMDIEDQENCDIRRMELVNYDGGIGYPGDGWTRKQADRKKDDGRKDKTNYMGEHTT